MIALHALHPAAAALPTITAPRALPPPTAPFLAAAAVLAAAGVAKAVRPDYTARALHAAGLPHHRRLVRAGALAEVAVSVAAVAVPGPVTAGLVAAAYTAFAVFVVAALRRGWALSSCGCFGKADSRPTYAHAALNAGAAASAVWWAVTGPHAPFRVAGHSPWHGAALLVVSSVIAGLAYLVWDNPLAKAVS